MGLSYFFRSGQTFSENENRVLQTFPKFSTEDLLRGSFMADIEGYINDQTLFRDSFMEFKTAILLLAGNKDINQVYIGKDGYLFQKELPNQFNTEQLNKNLEYINAFAANVEIPVSFILAPSSFSILQDKLPKYATVVDEKQLINNLSLSNEKISFVDIVQQLEAHREEYIYYKTDHHWTSLGAYYAYQAWQNKKGLDSQIEDYKIKELSSTFKGSLYSKVLNKNSAMDKILAFYPKKKIEYEVIVNFNQKVTDSIYDYDKLKTKDQYQVYLGGNYPEITIHTSNHNNRSILVFKDSFANSFLPFLVNDYENIYVIDLRYFLIDINQYMKERNIDEILFLYNVTNLAEDTSLKKLSIE